MKNQLQKLFQEILKDIGITDVVPEVSQVEDAAHGEYTSNVAMRLSKQLKKSPMDIALQVKSSIEERLKRSSHDTQDHKTSKKDASGSRGNRETSVLQAIDHIEVASPGFINIFLTEASLGSHVSEVLKQEERFGTGSSNTPEGIMVEYGDPNTHKAFHIGHLRNISIGESVTRLLEAVGSDVTRASYQGDVGMHIAKTLYALTRLSDFRHQLGDMRKKEIHEKIEFIGKAYAMGSKIFEEDEEVKKEIGIINKQIYAKDPIVYPIYLETRQWSLEYFEIIYKRVGTTYTRNYFESEVFEVGKQNVLDGLKKGIFEESQGAIIFPGDKFGLHTRVFITKEGNPTYEGKDMGLGPLEYGDLARWSKHPKLVIRIVGPEQAGYFQVVFEAHSQLFPELRNKYHHLIAGWVKLKHGKMSSRSGNVVLGEWLLDEAKKSIYDILGKNESKYTADEKEEIAECAAVAAVKYAFLKVSTDQEMAFDLSTSVSFDGDSGPYLLYSYARCKSILRKAESTPTTLASPSSLHPEERALARLISFFPEIVSQAASDLAPNVMCSYLFRLAQTFNGFYQKHSILSDSHRLVLTAATAQVLKNGLYLLGISTVERM